MLSEGERRNLELLNAALTAFNEHDLDSFFALHTEDMYSHEVYFPEPLGRETMRQFLEEYFVAYPDHHVEMLNHVATGDQIAYENRVTGTHLGEFQGRPASGKSFSIREAVFCEFANGLIRGYRIYLDRQQLAEQTER